LNAPHIKQHKERVVIKYVLPISIVVLATAIVTLSPNKSISQNPTSNYGYGFGFNSEYQAVF